MATTIHAGDCQTGCDTCTANYHEWQNDWCATCLIDLEKEDKNMSTLERERDLMGAKQDMHGRYYVEDSEGRPNYGYWTLWGGAYVCYTCGHLCDCGNEE